MLKKFWFQTHWLLGISAGLVLAIMGLSGAALSYEDAILAALNPDILRVEPQTQAQAQAQALTPPQLARVAQSLRPQARLQSLTVFADPARSARVMFAGRDPAARRGEILYLNPYDGRLAGSEAQLRGHELLHVFEDVHRRLAAGAVGKALTGASTLILLVLVLSGLYLRWPRRAVSWRSWLRLDVLWNGRALWWNLHAVVGTFVLPLYLLAAATGLFWSYDWYRGALFAMTGESPPQRPGAGGEGPRADRREGAPRQPVQAPNLDAAWAAFQRETSGYQQVSFNPPARPGEALQLSYLDVNAPHERASSRLKLSASGEVLERQPYAQKSGGGKLIASIFPLHAGSFFGEAGRLLMALASLLMPLFFITGWVLYLERRGRQRRAALRAAQMV